MKKLLIVIAFVISMVFSACSTPGNAITYHEPVIASETAVFIGTGLKYAEARNSAIQNGLNAGYTKIIAEVIEQEGIAGFIQVTLVMIK